jgi:hypothetical protein
MRRSESEAKNDIERVFPGLRVTGYRVTSNYDEQYNCIAFAAGDVAHWWEPDDAGEYFWPIDLRESTLECYMAAFGTPGFEPCDAAEVEDGYEKIAIYTGNNGEPQHAAWQTATGTWQSKLGSWEDIEHPVLDALEGNDYGHVAKIMKRRASESGGGVLSADDMGDDDGDENAAGNK